MNGVLLRALLFTLGNAFCFHVLLPLWWVLIRLQEGGFLWTTI